MTAALFMMNLLLLLGIGLLFPVIAAAIFAAETVWIGSNGIARRSLCRMQVYDESSPFKPQPIFRADHTRNYNIISLGSETAFWDLRYEGSARGLNYSTGCQSLSVDRKILMFYHSYLKSGGIVLFVVNPYDRRVREGLHFYSRFVKRLPRETKEKYGDYYSPVIFLLDPDMLPRRLSAYMKFPMLLEPLSVLKALLPARKEGEKVRHPKNSLPEAEGKELRQMALFCSERGYRPVLLISPVNENYSSGDDGNAIRDYAASVQRALQGMAPVLDCSMTEKWSPAGNFRKGNCLKYEAAVIFTKEILARLG